MDFIVKFTTPGHILSTRSMYGVISDLNKVFENATIEALISEHPGTSHVLIENEVKGKIDFNLYDARKGSWEIMLIGAIGGIIGKAAYDLTLDAIKTSETWDNFKKRLFAPSKKTATNIEEKLDSKKRLGPFAVESKVITIEKNNDGISKITYEATLIKTKDVELLVTSVDQVKKLLENPDEE